MFGSNPTYHGIFRSAIVAFGNLFSDIYIDRKKNGSVDGISVQKIHVPLAFANKEKWIVRLEQDPNLKNNTYTTLPRMSFEITGYTYDSARKVGKMQNIRCGNNMVYSPAPYTLDLSLVIVSKSQEDGLQILEQILPVFAPEYTVSVKAVPSLNIVQDIPIILNGVSVQDDFDGDMQMRRFVIHTLSFQMKLNVYGALQQPGNIILKTIVNVDTGDAVRKYTATGELETGEILFEGWEDD